MPALIQNAVFFYEDDFYLVSTHVHDYAEHVLPDGSTLAVDGGLEYARRAGDFIRLDAQNRYQEYSLTHEDPFEVVAAKLLWGTRGIDGKQLLRFRPIKEFSVDHLRAILDNCPNIGPMHKRVVEHWLAEKTKVAQGAAQPVS
jgi:phytoene dehydrogenase-like protein